MIKCFLLLIKGHCGKHRWHICVCVSHRNDEVAGQDLSGARLLKKCRIRCGRVCFVVSDKIRYCQCDCTVSGGLVKKLLVHS